MRAQGANNGRTADPLSYLQINLKEVPGGKNNHAYLCYISRAVDERLRSSAFLEHGRWFCVRIVAWATLYVQ